MNIRDIGASDDGIVALAKALPELTRLTKILCDDNPNVGDRGWVALFDALPSLPALDWLCAKRVDSFGANTTVIRAPSKRVASIGPRFAVYLIVYIMTYGNLKAHHRAVEDHPRQLPSP